jgi:hypothetical protein
VCTVHGGAGAWSYPLPDGLHALQKAWQRVGSRVAICRCVVLCGGGGGVTRAKETAQQEAGCG